ncbi:polyprenyl synthetase [Streptomyces racemochromogenes]|uniref:Polyprenyl synthetase n=1 Tax=Streptomyces racemochromogenes TaxID=67353 RepID=A0ABW7PBF8_9ACTN
MKSSMEDQGLDRQALLLAAGLADVAVSTACSALAGVRQLLRRSDGPDLVQDAQQDLMARGRIALERVAPAAPAHLEVLAQHVVARGAAFADDV